MSKSGDATARKLRGLAALGFPVGTFVSTNTDGTVNIDFGNGPVSCQSASLFQPLPGDSVQCLQSGSMTMMIGPSSARSAIGVVVAGGSPQITVMTSIGSRQMFYNPAYTPTVSDTVLIDWASGGVVIGKTSGVPAGSYTPPATSPHAFQVDFAANDSGTYYVPNGAYNQTDVWCTSTGNNRGAWFYGTTIADTIPDGATITLVEAFLPEFFNEFPSSLALIGLHTLVSKSGAPTISSAVSVPRGAGWVSLPTSFGDALKTGSMKGIGTGSSGSSGYHKYTGRAADADSGKLRIGWTV